VNQPTPLNLVMTSTPALCNGSSDGSASVVAAGGTSGYAYSWSPSGGTNSNATGLATGNYTVTVTDAHNCSASDFILVNQPTPLVANTISTDALCHGSADGTATVNVGGGTSAYQYLWSPGGATTANITGLVANTYNVHITDAHGCTINTSTVVNQPAALNLVMASSPAWCNGSVNGSASVIVTGGTQNYSYSWSPSGGTNATASGLSAGNYRVSVTDAHNCAAADSITVTQPTVLSANASATNALCNGSSDGTTTVAPGGGTPPYSYLWSPSGGTNANATGLAANNYSVTVTDANGCITNAATVVNQPALLNLNLSSIPARCFGSANGSASVIVNGGTPGYSYSWSPSGGTNANATGLAFGSYTVTVTDAHQCISSNSTSVGQPTALNTIMSMNPALCNGSSDGSATAIVAGGTFPYQYYWLPSGQINMTATGLHSGNYTVIVSDDHGCTDTSSVQVTAPTAIQPNANSTPASCFGSTDGTATAIVNGGTSPYYYSWSPSGGTNVNATGLSSGNYTVAITDDHGCTSSATVFVAEPPVVAMTVTGAATICIGQSATISANVTGGTTPYSYVWSNANTNASQNVSPVVTAVYSVNVHDAHGCTTAQQSVQVTVNPPLQVNATGAPPICEGNAVNISALASGGNGGPYYYSWNSGMIVGPNVTVAPVRDSIFVVTVTDGCGTPAAKDSVTLLVNPLPVVSFLPAQIKGCTPVFANFLDNSITPAGSSYYWDLGDNTLSNAENPSHEYVIPGSYTVSLVIQTPPGCLASLTVPQAVVVYPLPTAAFFQSSSVVTPNSTIDFTDNSINAYNWTWNFGDHSPLSYDQNPSHIYADTGYFEIRLMVNTMHGCADTTYGRLIVEDEFAIYIPNAFTPNGDGVNDGFIALGVGYVDYNMWIIDRWGKEIFHSTAKDQPWDGSYYNSNLCQSDVYEYIIEVHDKSGKPRKYIGHVTLVR
ncbi:MAG: PKD domain-containing protein, partial [Bacteroidetes bacterium]|nr:PKD domain-containing protein [Bacteroidota bacterium]